MKATRLFWFVLLIIVMSLSTLLIACGDDDDDDDDDTAGDDDTEDDDDTADDDDDATDDDDDATDDDDDATDDDDDATDDDDSFEDWFPPEAGDLGTYRINGYSEHWDVPAQIVGEDTTTFPGETYWVLEFGDLAKGGGVAAKIWADFTTPYKPGVKAMEAYDASSKAAYTIREVFDDVLYLAFDGDVDETKSQTVSGTMYFDKEDSMDFDVKVDTTLLSLDASADVPYGTVDNCIQVDVQFSDPSSSKGTSWGGDFFFHGDYGFVQAAVFPAFDVVELVSPPE